MGTECRTEALFVTAENLSKYYKSHAALDLKPLTLKWAEIADPEGKPSTGIILKQGDLPAGIPHCSIQLYSRQEITLQDKFLADSESLHENQASATHAFLTDRELSERTLRVGAMGSLQSWSDFNQKVEEQQRALEAKEAERLHLLTMSDQGIAPETNLTIVQSGSRLRRPAPTQQILDAATPPPKTARKATSGLLGPNSGRKANVAFGSSSTLPPPSRAVPLSSRASSSRSEARGASKQNGLGGILAVAEPGMCSSGPSNAESLHPVLAKLLVSSHGKPFPGIAEILTGVQIKRELSGARALASSWGLAFPQVPHISAKVDVAFPVQSVCMHASEIN